VPKTLSGISTVPGAPAELGIDRVGSIVACATTDSGLSIRGHPTRWAVGAADRNDKPRKFTERLYISRSPCPCPDVPSSRGVFARYSIACSCIACPETVVTRFTVRFTLAAVGCSVALEVEISRRQLPQPEPSLTIS